MDQFSEDELSKKLIPVIDQVHRPKDAEWPSFDKNSVFEKAVREIHIAYEIPKEMTYFAAFGVLATVCQGHYYAQLPSGYTTNLSLMLLTIIESGGRKSAAANAFFGVLNQYQDNQLEQSIADNQAIRPDRHNWKLALSALESKLKAQVKKDEDPSQTAQAIKAHMRAEPQLTKPHQFILNDVTPQAIPDFMKTYSKNAVLFSDEADSLFNGPAMRDMAFINKLWDGRGLRTDRKSTERIVVPNAKLSTYLLTQPESIQSFMDKHSERAHGLGFLARFLVVRPEPNFTPNYETIPESIPEKEAFDKRALRLLEDQWHKESSNTPATAITFSNPAGRLWLDMAKQLDSEKLDGGMYAFQRAHAGKLMENVTRIAALLTAFEGHKSKDNKLSDDAPFGGESCVDETFDNKTSDKITDKKTSDKKPDIEIQPHTLEFAYDFCLRCSKHFLTHLAGEPPLLKNANELVRYLCERSQDFYENFQKRNFKKQQCKLMDDWTGTYKPEYGNSGGKAYTTGFYYRFDLSCLQQIGPTFVRSFRGETGKEDFYRVAELLHKLGHLIINRENKVTKYYFFQVVPINFNPNTNRITDNLNRSRSEESRPETEYQNGREVFLHSLPMYEDLDVGRKDPEDTNPNLQTGQKLPYTGRFNEETTYYSIMLV